MQLRGMVETIQQVRDELAELATILAAGLQRLSDRKSSQKLRGVAETPLDCRALSEGHVRAKSEDMVP